MNLTRRWIQFALSCALGCLMAQSALAEKMDVETHDLVIQKLESVLPTLDSSVARTPLLIRLADLYSERARLIAMEESEKGCGEKCGKGSKGNRKKALAYYEQALPQAPKQERESIILQMTHLYELTEQKSKAIALYNRAIQEGQAKHTTAFLAQAYTGLGEIAYRDGKPTEALKHFTKAISYKDCPKRGIVYYRMGWSYLNIGQQKQAVDTLVKILKTPDLQVRESSDGPQVDKSFAEDVSRDLATFLARGSVGSREAQLLRDLSPAGVAHDNVLYLGAETDRLGNKPAALYVFKMILGMEITALQRLDALVHLPQIELDMGHKEQSINELEKVAQYWKKNGCQIEKGNEDTCKDLQSRLRKMVTDWDRRSRKKYQAELLQAYVIYTDVFPNDTEMQYFGGNVARNLKDFKKGIPLFHNASLLAASELKNGGDRKKLLLMFESSLLGEIELAEISKDLNLREAAYAHYLSLNAQGERKVEVRYQKAHVAFEKKQYDSAAVQFHDTALLRDTKSQQLRAQAADLAIDSLVELKDDERIETWANEFSHAFPAKRDEFAKVSRTASLNLVAKAAASKDSGDARSAMKRLKSVNLAGATLEDKISFYKTKLTLAEREKDLDETNRTADQMLALKGLTAADRDYALGRKVWAAEARLDFSQALKISKKMTLSGLSEGERLLRLAMLSELAGVSAKSYYEKYLQQNRKYLQQNRGKESAMVLAKLIRASKNPWADLRKNLNTLKRNPDVLASVTLDIYIKTKDHKKASEFMNVRGVLNASAGQTLARLLFLANYQELNAKISRSHIPTRGDAQIQKAVAQRLDAIHGAENMAQYAVNTQDWSLQILALSLLERENKRLYSDLLALPAPRKLKGKERTAYLENVQRQSQPYLTKSNDIGAKLKEFWQDTKALDEAVAVFAKARPEVQSFAVTEMRLLADVAGPRAKWKFNQVIAEHGERPSVGDLLRARRAVRENPFSLAAVQNLKKIEEQSGANETMVVYLDARLDQLQAGGRK